MFKVYDSNYKFLQLLDIVKNCYTTEQISTGTKNLYFEVPINDANLKIIVEENYIEIPAYDIKPKEFNRAKVKRETQRMIEEELYGGR